MRIYANNNRYPWSPSHNRWLVVEAPTGITFVGYENPPGVTTKTLVLSFLASDRASWYNHVNILPMNKASTSYLGRFPINGWTTCAVPSRDGDKW